MSLGRATQCSENKVSPGLRSRLDRDIRQTGSRQHFWSQSLIRTSARVCWAGGGALGSGRGPGSAQLECGPLFTVPDRTAGESGFLGAGSRKAPR